MQNFSTAFFAAIAPKNLNVFLQMKKSRKGLGTMEIIS
jgi:hypothetical protein